MCSITFLPLPLRPDGPLIDGRGDLAGNRTEADLNCPKWKSAVGGNIDAVGLFTFVLYKMENMQQKRPIIDQFMNKPTASNIVPVCRGFRSPAT